MKYDNHKTGCAASSYKYFICFQEAVNTFQTTTTGSLIQRAGWGGDEPATYGPRRELGASERLLSALSVLINIPSSRVMINANLIDCVSEEKPVSQNEVRLRLPGRSPSHRGWTQSSSTAFPRCSIRAAWPSLEVIFHWCFRLRWRIPELKENSSEAINTKRQRQFVNSRWSCRTKMFAPYKRLESGSCFRFAYNWLTSAISQHFMWRRAKPLGARAHGHRMAGLRGCSQPSLGAWPFQVIDWRSKRHFLRGDLWRYRQSRSLFRPSGVQTTS